MNGLFYKAKMPGNAMIYRAKLLNLSREAQARLTVAVNDIFDAYEANVDPYLDEFYSFKGDIKRLKAMAFNELEEYLQDSMKKAITKNVDYSVVSNIYHDFNLQADQYSFDALKTHYQVPVSIIQILTGKVRVLGSINEYDLKTFVEPPEFINLKYRYSITAGATLASGVVAGYVTHKFTQKLITQLVKKIVSSAIYKRAIRELVKVLGRIGLSRLGGAIAGAGAGALAGAPTGPGAIATGIIGAIGGAIAFDTAFRVLDEAINRDEYRASLIQAIEEARAEALESLVLGAEEPPNFEASLRPKGVADASRISKRSLAPAASPDIGGMPISGRLQPFHAPIG
jgi:hypothetical protein